MSVREHIIFIRTLTMGIRPHHIPVGATKRNKNSCLLKLVPFIYNKKKTGHTSNKAMKIFFIFSFCICQQSQLHIFIVHTLLPCLLFYPRTKFSEQYRLIVLFAIYLFLNMVFDSLCGLVVRVSGCRFRGPGFNSRRFHIF
jgi:hypothetical protein